MCSSLACLGREGVGSAEKRLQRSRKSCPQGSARPGLRTLDSHLRTSPLKKGGGELLLRLNAEVLHGIKASSAWKPSLTPRPHDQGQKQFPLLYLVCSAGLLPFSLLIFYAFLKSSTRISIKARTTVLDNLLWAVRCQDCGVDGGWREVELVGELPED